MVFFSDSHEIVDRFGEYILECQHAFATYDVRFGSPDDFCALPRNLKSNLALREDLSTLVRSLMEKESGKVSLRIVLTIVAIASGGPEIARSDHDIGRPVNQVVDFLISAAGGTQIDADHMDSMYSGADPGNDGYIPNDQQEPIFDRSPEDEEARHYRELSSDTSADTPGDTPGDTSPYSPHHAPSTLQLNQSLARLELNSHEVKLYLDSIDQRISRMEPHLEGFSPVEPSAPAQPSRQASGTNGWAATTAVEEQTPVVTEAPQPARQPPSQPSPQPLARKRLVLWPVLLGLITVLAGAALYRKSERRIAYTPVHSSPNSAGTPSFAATDTSGAARAPGAATSAPASSPAYPFARTGQLKTSAATPALQPRDSTATSSPSAAPAPTSLPAAQASHETTSADTPSETASATLSYPAASVSRSAPRSLPLSTRTVSVSSGVMAANLVSAPMPSYPKLAALTHMQGEVVLQAIISRRGTVEHLHVIKGHRLLRSSAMNAVKNWRYRPYFVNGRAVEVATIVTVDFRRGH